MKMHISIMALSASLVLAVSGCGAGEREKISVESESSVQKETESAENSSGRIEIKEVPDSESVSEGTGPGTGSQDENSNIDDIASELKQIEEQSAELELKLYSSKSQGDMNAASGDHYKLWDGELNQLWGRLKKIMREEDFSALTEEERKWIAKKDAEVNAASNPYEDGTMYPMITAEKAAELTRERVYILAELLSAKNGQAYADSFSGAYTAPKETDNLPCSLYLNYLGVGTYDAELGLGSGASWKPKGIARADGETLLFEDPTLGVKGIIAHGDTGLTVTVTESELAEAAAGTRFDFPEKCEYPTQFSFADISDLEFWFGSGAGAWRTVLYVHEDGSFDGEYLDSDMGSREYYLCDFKGKFTTPEQVNDYTWAVKIQSLELADEPDTSEVKDGFTWHYSEPYGLTDAEEILFYLPNAPIAELPADFKSWASAYPSGMTTQALLPFYGLYNVNGLQGFSSHPKADES